jgi:hypothetical protein
LSKLNRRLAFLPESIDPKNHTSGGGLQKNLGESEFFPKIKKNHNI